MSGARSTVRLPTSRLLPAVTAALKAAEGERWADVEAAIALEMSRPVRWWTVRATTQTEAVLAAGAQCARGETVAVVLRRMAPAGAERTEG